MISMPSKQKQTRGSLAIGLWERREEWEGRPTGRTIGDAAVVESTSTEREREEERKREHQRWRVADNYRTGYARHVSSWYHIHAACSWINVQSVAIWKQRGCFASRGFFFGNSTEVHGSPWGRKREGNEKDCRWRRTKLSTAEFVAI